MFKFLYRPSLTYLAHQRAVLKMSYCLQIVHCSSVHHLSIFFQTTSPQEPLDKIKWIFSWDLPSMNLYKKSSNCPAPLNIVVRIAKKYFKNEIVYKIFYGSARLDILCVALHGSWLNWLMFYLMLFMFCYFIKKELSFEFYYLFIWEKAASDKCLHFANFGHCKSVDTWI